MQSPSQDISGPPQWFVQVGTNQRGPFSSAQLKAFVSAGKIGPKTHVRRADMATWVLAGKVKGLFAVASPAALQQHPAPQPNAGAGSKSTVRDTPSATAISVLVCSLFVSGLMAALVAVMVFRSE